MKGYSLVKEHADHFELSHPKDGTFRVAKAQLGPTGTKKARALPQAMHGGGEVEGAEEGDDQVGEVAADASASDVPATPEEYSFRDSPLGKFMRGETTGTGERNPDFGAPIAARGEYAVGQAGPAGRPEYSGQPTPEAPAPAAAPSASPNPSPGAGHGPLQSDQNPPAAPAPNPTADAAGMAGTAYGEQAAGIKAAAAAQQTYANEAQKAQEDLTRSLQEAKNTYDRKYSEVDAENKRLTDDVMNAKIDPTRVWSQMSTGNKVMAGIGILLSGIGSGMTGQQNMAMEVINKTIDRDIEAQKAELGKKETLLSMNFHKYGNITAAYHATAAQMYAITQGQVGAAAAKMGGQVAQANAQMAMGQLHLQQAQAQQALAMHGVGVALGAGAGAGGPINLENLPKDIRDRAVQLPNGGVVLARDPKERGEVQDSLTHLQTIASGVTGAINFMDKTGRTAWGTAENARAESLRNSIVLSLNKLHDLNRLTEPELEMFKEMVPSPGAWRQDRAKAQLEELGKLITNKRNAEFLNHTEGYNPGRGAGRDAVLTGGH